MSNGKVVRDGVIYRTGRAPITDTEIGELRSMIEGVRKWNKQYPTPDEWRRWNRYWSLLSYRPDRFEIRLMFLKVFVIMPPVMRGGFLEQSERLARKRIERGTGLD